MTSQSKPKSLLTPVHTDGSAEEAREALLTVLTDCRYVKYSFNIQYLYSFFKTYCHSVTYAVAKVF